MDEYGEFIDEDDDEGAEFFGQHAYDTDEREPELPGLTDEAKRLLEVAREELEAEEPPHSRCAAGCFGVPDVAQEGRRPPSSPTGSTARRAAPPRWSRSAARCRGATTAARAPW